MKLEFSRQIFEKKKKKAHISNFIKIRLMGAELFHAGGQMDGHDKSKSSFSQFCKCAKKKKTFYWLHIIASLRP
jgi:hypothetical protein